MKTPKRQIVRKHTDEEAVYRLYVRSMFGSGDGRWHATNLISKVFSYRWVHLIIIIVVIADLLA